MKNLALDAGFKRATVVLCGEEVARVHIEDRDPHLPAVLGDFAGQRAHCLAQRRAGRWVPATVSSPAGTVGVVEGNGAGTAEALGALACAEI